MISLKNVTKKYGNQIVFDNVSYDFKSNGLYLIKGESGAGKTTFINIVSGIDLDFTGNIKYNTKDYNCLDLNKIRRDDYAFVFQDTNLISELNVYDNITMPLCAKSEKIQKNKIIEILELVKLKGYEGKKTNTLSGGEKQRVAIARALVKNPKVLFADELTGMLDKENSTIIYNILREISKKILVIVSSHDVDNIEKYVDEIIEIKEHNIIHYKINEIVENEYQNEIKKEKSSGLFLFLKLGFEYIKLKPFKFIFSLLLVTFSLIFLGVSFSISSYNSYNYEAEIIYKSNYDCFSVYKSEIQNNNLYQTTISNNDISVISNTLNSKFYKVKKVYGSNNLLTRPDYLKDYNYIINESISAVSYIDEAEIENNGYTLYGKIPTTSGEIMISDFFYKSFYEYGYYDKDNDIKIIKPTYDEIINKTISLCTNIMNKEYKQYVICGILNTKFDYDKFNDFAIYNRGKSYDVAIQNELNSYKACSFHSLAYVSKDEILSENEYDYIITKMPSKKIEIVNYIKFFNDNNEYRTILPTSDWFENVDSLSNIIKNVCLIVGYVLLGFSIVLLFTIFNYMISNKSKDIGILLAFGAKKKNIISIFLLESLIITLVAIIFASIAIVPILNIVNGYVNPDYILISKPFYFSFINFISMLCLVLLLDFFSIILPLILIMKKNPIELIKKVE